MQQDFSTTASGQVTGIKTGAPPLLGIRIQGKRSLLKWLPVYNQELFERLQAQVHLGDMICISTCTALKEEKGRHVTYLTDFSLFPGEK